jgi:hypothetical protein
MARRLCYLAIVATASLLLAACNEPFYYETPPPKDFSNLDRPIVFAAGIREDQSSLGKGLLFDNPYESGGYYYVVYDWTSDAVFNKTVLPDTGGLDTNPIALYSAFSDSYWFLSYTPRVEAVKINPKTGTVSNRIALHRAGPMITDENALTKEGYAIVTHSMYEEGGIRISLLDTSAERVAKDDIFLQDGLNRFAYDGDSTIYYIAPSRHGGFYDLNALNLINGECRYLYTNPQDKPGAGLAYYNGNLYMVENDAYNYSANGPIYRNKPFLCVLSDGVLVKREEIPLEYDFLSGGLPFIYDGTLYYIFNDSHIGPRELHVRMSLYALDPSSDTLALKGYFFDAYCNMGIQVRDSTLIFLYQESMSKYRICQVDIDTLEVKSRTTFSLY